jgi:hypothetical protein
MDATQITGIIRRRRDAAFDSQILGYADDPLTYTAADLTRAIADEYDSLLIEIGAIRPEEAKSA